MSDEKLDAELRERLAKTFFDTYVGMGGWGNLNEIQREFWRGTSQVKEWLPLVQSILSEARAEWESPLRDLAGMWQGINSDVAKFAAMQLLETLSTYSVAPTATPAQPEGSQMIPLMNGLDIKFGDDGTWLAFKDSKGNSSIIRLESLADASGRIIGTTIQEWSKDRRRELIAGGAAAGTSGPKGEA